MSTSSPVDAGYMDIKISKTKLLQKSYEPRAKWSKNTPENSPIRKKDVNNQQMQPVIDNVKTPQRITDRPPRFLTDSPQFRVGWNDGFDSSVLPGAESPVIPSVQQRIRRCPDELYRGVKKTAHPKNLEIERDRQLGCVTWAKNLLEISLEPQNESPAEPVGGVDTAEGSLHAERLEQCMSDSRIDITDDTVDEELLVLCSQAVEEEVIGKRSRSPEYCQTKKQKLTESPKGRTVAPVETRASKILDFDRKSSMSAGGSTEIIKKSDKLVDSMDLFKCVLDDDDEFSSIDFNCLDNIQNTYTQNRPVPKPILTECYPKPRYTKEQIEQRRLEAKKKLLFKKKHKSM